MDFSWRNEKASIKQCLMLEGYGINASSMTKGMASNIISAIINLNNTHKLEKEKLMKKRSETKDKYEYKYKRVESGDGHKKCPFCGGTPTLVECVEKKGSSYIATFYYYHYIRCNKCKVQTNHVLMKSLHDDGDTITEEKSESVDTDVWKAWDER